MRKLISLLGMAVVLTACSGADSRYKDTAMLEKPPTLPRTAPVNDLAIDDDTSSIPKKREGKGLGSDVYLVAEEPPQLAIKEPFDKAWGLLNQALKLKEIKVTDQVRSRGHIYVDYGAAGLLEKAIWFLSDGHKAANYLLRVEDHGAETRVTVTMTGGSEAATTSGGQDGYYDEPADTSKKLLDTLFETLRDDLEDEL